MTRSKLVVFFTVFLVGFLFSQELYIQYLSCFDSKYYSIPFDVTKDGNDEILMEDIQTMSNANNLKVFFVDEKSGSTRNQEINIYADETCTKYLKEIAQVQSGDNVSLFSGSITINFISNKDLTYDVVKDEPGGFRFIGEYSDIIKINDYIGDDDAGKPQNEGYDSLAELKTQMSVVWGLIVLLIILTECFYINSEKKEIFVRFTVGEPILSIIRNCVIRDCALIIASLLCVYSILKITFEIKTILIAILVIMLFIAILYIRLYWYDVSEIFANKKVTKGMVVGNYIVKAIAFILVICTISTNIVVISQWLDYDKQSELYERNKQASHIQFYHRDEICYECELLDKAKENGKSLDTELVYNFYINQEKQGDAYIMDLLMENVCKDEKGEISCLIYASSGMEEYLKSKISEMKDVKPNTLYVILHENMDVTESEKKQLFGWFDSDVGMDIDNYEKIIIEYKEDVFITSLDCTVELDSDIKKNPVIVFETVKDKKIAELREWRYSLNVPYDRAFIETDKNEIDKYLKENNVCKGVDYNINNVWEIYEANLISLKRVSIISIAIIGLITLMFVFVNQIILKMIYNGYGVELSVKKTLGYSVLERFRTIFIVDAIIGVVSVLGAYCICKRYKLCNPTYILLVGVLVIVLQMVYIWMKCKKMDNENVQKILKGGCL